MFCREQGAGGLSDSYNTPSLDMVFLLSAKEFNARVELYISPNGTPPAPNQFVPGNLISSYDDLYRPLQLTS
jgi:hypothetical protein